MEKILIFAGTGDGRRLAEHISRQGMEVHVCVATEYGEAVMDQDTHIVVHRGRLTEKEMEGLLLEQSFCAVVDATHPYAAEVSQNLRAACEACGKKYLRLLRSTEHAEDDTVLYVDSKEQAAAFLNAGEGNILFTTGSKELGDYCRLIEKPERIYARILADSEMIKACSGMGLKGKQIICMQGPFTEELNAAMLKQLDARYLVTKETGAAGGFPEKLAGAKAAGARVVVIRRPKEERGYDAEAILKQLGIPGLPGEEAKRKRAVTLLGIGMGDAGSMTREAWEVCQKADVILGAGRMLLTLRVFEKPLVSMYQSAEILRFLAEHEEYRNAVVAFSGDVGFYSGAKKLAESIDEREYEVRMICGISSVVYFCARLKKSWEDVKLVSMHGRQQNIAGAVLRNEKVFSLATGAEGIRKLSEDLISYGLGHVTMYVGCQLSYPQEEILTGAPGLFLSFEKKGLSVVLIENVQAKAVAVTHGLPDSAFVRGKAPMTKEEVRSISISKLALTRDAVVFDIGAGTGSIGIECARIAVDGSVYAIEKKEEALQLLKENKHNLQAYNLNIVAGTAPEALLDLPRPSHAFIGGSGGKLKELAALLIKMNPNIRIVVNAIAMETIAELVHLIEEKKPDYADIVQVSVGKAKEMGQYHMMMGQNPVYIVTIQGGMT